MLVSILDGYIDEPSSLGVPPFISPLVRYLAGAILDSGHEMDYVTVDSYRSSSDIKERTSMADLLVMVSGVSVPGRYTRGMPMSMRETERYSKDFRGPVFLAGFSAFGKGLGPELFDKVLTKDADAHLFDILRHGLCSDKEGRRRTVDEWNRWSVLGARVTALHPDHPQPLIAEVDVYKGCPRFHGGGCSFCSEVLLGPPRFRDPEDVGDEVRALAKAGVTNFRLACPCIISYKATGLKEGRIVPSPKDVEMLLKAVRGAAGESSRVLHVDNADPGVIARNPSESERILRALVENCTSGNILSLGLESADPKVIEANNLNSRPEEVLDAISLINKVGGKRGPTGLARLLPGLNFIAGLEGETTGTYKKDLDLLRKVLDDGLLLRRINIRQVMEHRRRFPGVRKRKDFMRFKTAVREDIDRPMLERVLPLGTILRDLYVEYRKGGTTFARQVGTYPVLVGIPARLEVKGFFDGAIVGWGQRSVTAVPYPLDINKVQMTLLSALPGIGKKRAARIVRARPFKSMEDLSRALDKEDLVEDLRHFFGEL